VPVWIDDRARIAHAKTMVVDGTVTLMGSYNWPQKTRRTSTSSRPQPCRRPIRRTGGSDSPSPSGSIAARIGAGFHRRRPGDG
jgi:hypothetical protein